MLCTSFVAPLAAAIRFVALEYNLDDPPTPPLCPQRRRLLSARNVAIALRARPLWSPQQMWAPQGVFATSHMNGERLAGGDSLLWSQFGGAAADEIDQQRQRCSERLSRAAREQLVPFLLEDEQM
jgi:hypothetical protein